MLPDFPKSRHEIQEKLRLRMYLNAQARSPVSSLGSSVTQHEGTLHSYEQVTRGRPRTVTEGFEEINVPIEVKIEDIPELVGEKLVARIDALGEEIARQTSQITFRKMDEVTREAGMSVDAGGPPTKELWLKMSETMDFDFDPQTKSPNAVFIAHPVMAEAMQKLWSQWEEDRAFMKRYKEILAQKFEEWRDRESRRKLVD